ncbi:MAG: hypothetical protein ACKVU4_04185 [Phycisphaerales bacterium]
MEPSPTNDPDQLREFLGSRDAPCPGCGYNLHGLTGDRCPECNEELRLQVGLVEPKLASFLTGLIGLACGAGFFGVLVVWIGVLWFRSRGGPGRRELVVGLVGLIVQGVALFLWLWLRPRVRGLPLAVRVSQALACWVLTAVCVIVCLAFFIR